jgi:predicted SprT family Zn-dependent metalloprotease
MSHPELVSIQKTAHDLARDLAGTWSLPGEALSVTVAANPRLRRAVARFLRNKQVIEVGPRFFEVPARQREVLCHELAHAAIDFLHGPHAKAHGPEWRRLVEAAGYRPEARTTRAQPIKPESACAARRASPKTSYEHRCPVCQMVRRAKRRVPQWRCTACVAAGLPGTLVIERMPGR